VQNARRPIRHGSRQRDRAPARACMAGACGASPALVTHPSCSVRSGVTVQWGRWGRSPPHRPSSSRPPRSSADAAKSPRKLATRGHGARVPWATGYYSYDDPEGRTEAEDAGGCRSACLSPLVFSSILAPFLAHLHWQRHVGISCRSGSAGSWSEYDRAKYESSASTRTYRVSE
jgi:hypothetical protein